MKKSSLDKLHEAEIWIGPKAHLSEKLRFAYQLTNNQAFIGVFEKGAFKDYPEFDTGNNTLYLGKPCELFRPIVGRDKIRDANGELKLISSEEDLAGIPVKKKSGGIATPVKKSKDVVVCYPLDHARQRNFMEPAAFDGYNIVLSGAGPLGLEIGVQVMKMGLHNLSIYDPTEVPSEDLAIGGYRIFDAHRARASVAYEIIADQTMQEPKILFQYLTEEPLGQIVINTFPATDVRQVLWNMIKNREQVGIFLDVQLSSTGGKLYAVNPKNAESVELYEASLGEEAAPETIIPHVKILAGMAAAAVQRYINSPGAEKENCLDRMYSFDIQSFFRDAGCWGKTR